MKQSVSQILRKIHINECGLCNSILSVLSKKRNSLKNEAINIAVERIRKRNSFFNQDVDSKIHIACSYGSRLWIFELDVKDSENHIVYTFVIVNIDLDEVILIYPFFVNLKLKIILKVYLEYLKLNVQDENLFLQMLEDYFNAK